MLRILTEVLHGLKVNVDLDVPLHVKNLKLDSDMTLSV